MTTAALSQYTGNGQPPCCEVLFKAADNDESSPPDLNIDVKVENARKLNIKLKKRFVKCVCQVFSCKESINCWKLAFVFSPKKYIHKTIEVSELLPITVILLYIIFNFINNALACTEAIR